MLFARIQESDIGQQVVREMKSKERRLPKRGKGPHVSRMKRKVSHDPICYAFVLRTKALLAPLSLLSARQEVGEKGSATPIDRSGPTTQ
jgi:hypothetical protein